MITSIQNPTGMQNTGYYSQKKAIKPQNITFGYKVFVDSGASDPKRGSFKVSIRSEQSGKEIFSTQQLPDNLKKVGPEGGFNSVADYINGLSDRISQSIKLAKSEIHKLKGADKKLSGVLINAPGYVVGGKTAPKIANLLDQDGQSLKDVDFTRVKVDAEKNPNNFKLIATNDMHGAAVGVAKLLKAQGKLEEGFYGLICMTGGGMGLVSIKVKNGFLEIEGCESGHNRVLEKGKAKSLEKDAASVSALLFNYAKKLGLEQQEIQDLINKGDARLVTQAFLAGDKPEKTAARAAINKYIDCLAQEFARKVAEGANLVILSGPVALGIKNCLSQKTGNPDELKERLTQKIKQHLPETGPGEIMSEIHNFDIDLNMVIPDNTVGGGILLDSAKFIGEKVRGNWINIPITDIK